jgi:hypothetical protein
MAGITDQEIDRNRCILMFDDETVADAVAALRDAQGAEWWHLVVDAGGGAYGAAAYSTLSDQLKKEQAAFLSKPLGGLVGSILPKVEVTGDQGASDPNALKEKAAETASHVAVITSSGEFRGILTAGATRSAGLFSSDLVGLAGQYAELPKKGLLGSRRRQAAIARKSK